jgi:hypothetical protein
MIVSCVTKWVFVTKWLHMIEFPWFMQQTKELKKLSIKSIFLVYNLCSCRLGSSLPMSVQAWHSHSVLQQHEWPLFVQVSAKAPSNISAELTCRTLRQILKIPPSSAQILHSKNCFITFDKYYQIASFLYVCICLFYPPIWTFTFLIV